MSSVEIGVSTASLFKKQYNEDAIPSLNSIDCRVCEVFLESYYEYNPKFGKLLGKKLNGLRVHSLHTMTTQFEPQLFADNERAYNDAVKAFTDVMKVAKILGATNYTMHGRARFRRTANYDDYKQNGECLNKIIDVSEKYGVNLCLENVEWASYNRPSFFKEVKKFCPRLKGCLDIKQARITGYDYSLYLEEMGQDIQTVHLSDFDENGKGCIPGKGTFDYETLFKKLKDNGFCGNMLIEVYAEAFSQISELKDGLDYLRNIKEKIF